MYFKIIIDLMYFNSFNILCKNCSEIYEIKRDSIVSTCQKIFLNEITKKQKEELNIQITRTDN